MEPEDPFSPEFGEGFEDVPEDQQALLRELHRAGEDANALGDQESFRNLLAGVAALHDVRARGVLLRLYIDFKRVSDPTGWQDWMLR